MMRIQDFLEAQAKAQQSETPEQKEHERRLEFRIDRFKIELDDGSEILLEQKASKPSQVRVETEGIAIAHFEPGVADGDVDDRSTHRWEEFGGVTVYPWHRIREIHHSWWIDEDAAEIVSEDRSKPSPYL